MSEQISGEGIPRGWDAVSIKEIGEIKLGRQRSPQHESGRHMMPYLRVANVMDGFIRYTDVLEMNFSPSEQEIYSLRDKDILLNEGQSLELVGRSAMYRGETGSYCYQNTLIRYRCGPRFLPEFARRVFSRMLAAGHFMRVAKQTTSIAHLGVDRFGGLRFLLPSLEEQRRIAGILDAADRAIRSTERTIVKLDQIKQGLLHDLLSRGVDGSGGLRDFRARDYSESAIGVIPNEWNVRCLGDYLESIEAGRSPDLPDRPAAAGEWGVLKVSAIRPEGLQEAENKVVKNGVLIDGSLEIKHGDALVSRANTPELVGLACYVRHPRPGLMLSDKTLRLRVSAKSACTEFVVYLLQSPIARRQIEISGTGSSGSMKNISQSDIRNILLPWPCLQEQMRIVQRLDDLRRQSETALSELGKLRLVKHGLMDELLTGRVRV